MDSFFAINYEAKNINITFVDNGSCDRTLQLINNYASNHSFNSIAILQNKNDYMSGYNLGAQQGSSPYVFFLDITAVIEPDFFNNLAKSINDADGKVAAYECRVLPFDTTQFYDPITCYTKVADYRAFVISRKAFEDSGGFDTRLPSAVCGADLCFKINVCGYNIKYLPKCSVTITENIVNPLDEFVDKKLGLLLLHNKYSSIKEIFNTNKAFIKLINKPPHFKNIRKTLLKTYLSHFKKAIGIHISTIGKKRLKGENSFDFDTTFSLLREPFTIDNLKNKPFVSIIIRTYNRSKFLQRCLTSVENQTYTNFEVVICEDGEPLSKDLILSRFSHLNIKYINDNIRKGRSKNGNLGLENATGEWCFFLDDDDYLYPEHVECMLCAAQNNPDAQVVLGSATAAFYDMNSDKLIRLEPMVFDRIDIFTMCQKCRIPIQTGFFKRELFLSYGGLKEGIDAHEDWAMWLKFYRYANFSNNRTADVTRVTSVFVQDDDVLAMQHRSKDYSRFDEAFFGDDELKFSVTLAQMRGFYQDMLMDIEHLHNNGNLDDYLKTNKK